MTIHQRHGTKEWNAGLLQGYADAERNWKAERSAFVELESALNEMMKYPMYAPVPLHVGDAIYLAIIHLGEARGVPGRENKADG